MPRNLSNWTYKDIVGFLKRHHFVRRPFSNGSHHYYAGLVDDEKRLVEVQYHASDAISPKCLQHDIIPKTGIPVKVWRDWAKAGSKKARRSIKYAGATKMQQKG